MKEVIMYEIKCYGGCDKTTIKKDKYDSFVCNSCEKTVVEPKLEDFDNPFTLMTAVEKYKTISKRDTSYDSNTEIQKLAKKKSTIPKKYIDKCWSYAYQSSHAYGMNDILCTFNDLEDIFN